MCGTKVTGFNLNTLADPSTSLAPRVKHPDPLGCLDQPLLSLRMAEAMNAGAWARCADIKGKNKPAFDEVNCHRKIQLQKSCCGSGTLKHLKAQSDQTMFPFHKPRQESMCHVSFSKQPDLDLGCQREQGDRSGDKEWEWWEFKSANSLPSSTPGSLKKGKI